MTKHTAFKPQKAIQANFFCHERYIAICGRSCYYDLSRGGKSITISRMSVIVTKFPHCSAIVCLCAILAQVDIPLVCQTKGMSTCGLHMSPPLVSAVLGCYLSLMAFEAVTHEHS
jgi:hypothetical protein